MKNQVSLYVGTPTLGHPRLPYVHSLLGLQAMCTQLGWPFTWHQELGTTCWRARDIIAKQFLASTASHLLFLDDDTAVDYRDVLALIAADYPVSGLAVRLKTQRPDVAIFNIWSALLDDADRQPLPEPEQRIVTVPIPGGKRADRPCRFASVPGVGAAAVLVRRDAFERVKAHFGNTLDYGASTLGTWTGFFREIISPSYISEDIAFCKRVREAGMEIRLLLDATTQHAGEWRWTGCVGDGWEECRAEIEARAQARLSVPEV